MCGGPLPPPLIYAPPAAVTSSCTRNGGDRPAAEQTLVEAALEVLNAADPVEKARLGEVSAARWLRGAISRPYRDTDYDGDPPPVPDRPARPSNVKLVPSHLMPKLGKGGSLQSRQAILHSLVHTESWAIDLSWDIIARFGERESMPREFFTDFVRVAQDEGRHFKLLAGRLQELGSFYAAFPAHDGLWDSATKTSKDLMARLAIEHCVHEARGLDVLPTIISRFRKSGDECTAKLLETVVYPEEIIHCAAGVKWFRYLCLRKYQNAASVPSSIKCQNPVVGEDTSDELRVGRTDSDTDPSPDQTFRGSGTGSIDEDGMVIQAFHVTVRRYFRGVLKPPFNKQAREIAGFGPDWYEPLAVGGGNHA